MTNRVIGLQNGGTVTISLSEDVNVLKMSPEDQALLSELIARIDRYEGVPQSFIANYPSAEELERIMQNPPF